MAVKLKSKRKPLVTSCLDGLILSGLVTMGGKSAKDTLQSKLRSVRNNYFRKSANPAEMIEILVLKVILCILSHERRFLIGIRSIQHPVIYVGSTKF